MDAHEKMEYIRAKIGECFVDSRRDELMFTAIYSELSEDVLNNLADTIARKLQIDMGDTEEEEEEPLTLHERMFELTL